MFEGEGELEAFTGHSNTVDRYIVQPWGRGDVPGLAPVSLNVDVDRKPTHVGPTLLSDSHCSWTSSEPETKGLRMFSAEISAEK